MFKSDRSDTDVLLSRPSTVITYEFVHLALLTIWRSFKQYTKYIYPKCSYIKKPCEADIDDLEFTLDSERIPDEDEGIYASVINKDGLVVPKRICRNRTLSESVTNIERKAVLNRTTSWPRGILKHRSRSLSESNIGVSTAWSSLGSSIDLDDVIENEEDITSCENSVSSSLKKSVRFNDVVKSQLFRANSSILGQRAKNQRKAAKKKVLLERRASYDESQSVELENSSLGGSTEEDPIEMDLDLKALSLSEAEASNNSSQSESTCDSNQKESNNDNCDNKNKKKKKSKSKKSKKVELSNNLIFQLDME